MKKHICIWMTLLFAAALLSGCRNPNATPTSSPTAMPSASPSASPSATPSATPPASPSEAPSPSPSASQQPSAPASPGASPTAAETDGLASWDSEYGFTLQYDKARYRAYRTDGSERFVPQESEAGLPATFLAVQRYTEYSASELKEGLLLQNDADCRELTDGIGTQPYSVAALGAAASETSASPSDAEHWYYILDCGDSRLLFETGFPARDKETAGELRAMLDSVTLVGDTALTQILAEVKNQYGAGTAGSSLRALALAGRLLDWYAGTDPETTVLSRAASAYFETLDEQETAQMTDDLGAIYDAAVQLTGEEGKSLLEASGYSAQYFPWKQTDAETLFTALLDAIDKKSDAA